MAWRPQRDGGVTPSRPRQANRPVYEDFQPQTDTIEEEGARIVILRVPGSRFPNSSNFNILQQFKLH